MEFQFGTNWSHFARTTGGVIGQPLAMEGVFSFFLESAFLGPLPFRRKAPVPAGTLGLGLSGFCRLLDFWLFHHRHQRLDAASRRLPRSAQWRL